jgi:enoyl-CoA hydratase/carnithine racemase
MSAWRCPNGEAEDWFPPAPRLEPDFLYCSVARLQESGMSEGKIESSKDGAVGWLVFNNPQRLNAVSYEMWRSLPEEIAGFVDDPDIRVVVLRGEGDKAFISGADISQFEKARSSEAGIADYDDATRWPTRPSWRARSQRSQ